jgi:magnesium chelatase subunit D
LFPFTATVGQETAKRALLASIVNPSVGGTLLRGERGCAKSTLARALGRVLPMQRVVAGCPYRCDPDDRGTMCASCAATDPELITIADEQMRVVELPISASADRIVGGIDVVAALRGGCVTFSPGILAAANRNVLFLDEVNLVGAEVVDMLVDVAASGLNIVEREGISVVHPARFTLVGTMNPEEGELRPQLLDRFGLCVDTAGLGDVASRVEVAERHAAFRRHDPDFIQHYDDEDQRVAESLQRARAAVRQVSLSPEMGRAICTMCLDAGVSGHRADVVMRHTVVALAAQSGRNRGVLADINDAGQLALAHRARQAIKQRQPSSPENRHNSAARDEHEPDANKHDDPSWNPPRIGHPEPPRSTYQSTPSANGTPGTPRESPDAAATRGQGDIPAVDGRGVSISPDFVSLSMPTVELPRTRRPRATSGRRMRSRAVDRRGRHVASQAQDPVTDIAIDATLRVAAPLQIGRGWTPGEPLRLRRSDLRQKVREHKVSSLIVFVVDGSASMVAEARMAMTKSAILSLLHDAYVRRDRVAAVVFQGRYARTVLPPTSSVSLAERLLAELPVGGSTPMSHGLWMARQLIQRERKLDPSVQPLLVLVSDGYPNVAVSNKPAYQECVEIAELIAKNNIAALVVDSDHGEPKDGAILMYEDLRPSACPVLAECMGATYIALTELSAEQLSRHVIRMRT